MIPFSTQQDGDRELIELAFSKKKADDRKEWLRQFKVRVSPVSRCPVVYLGRPASLAPTSITLSARFL